MDKKIQTAILSRAELQHGLITRGQALERGLKSADIHRQVAKGRWETLGRGVYRIGGTPKTYEQSVKAVTFARPGAVAHLRTAARLYGLPIGEFEEVEIAIVRRTRARTVEGVTVRLLPRLDAVDRSRPSGIPATSLTRTVLDLPAVLDPQLAGKVTDHVLALRRTTLKYLAERLEAIGPNEAGREIAAQLIAERQGRNNHPDSWYQARLVDIVRQLALEGWVQEYEILLPDGTRRRIDLAFVLIRLAIEVVSYLHHSQLVDWSADQVRNNQLMRQHWWLLYITTYDIEHNPEAVGREILQTIEDLCARAVAGA